MRISAKGLGITSALTWGGCLLLVGLVNLMAPSYGTDFLRVMGSVYPGVGTQSLGSVLLGTLYGLIDGMIGGWLFATVYNFIARE